MIPPNIQKLIDSGKVTVIPMSEMPAALQKILRGIADADTPEDGIAAVKAVEAAEPLVFTAGNFYETMGGEKAFIYDAAVNSNGDMHGYVERKDGKVMRLWKKNGAVLAAACPADNLVGEWVEPKPEPDPAELLSIDDKIMVRNSEADVWAHVSFATFKDGKVYAWRDGNSFHSHYTRPDGTVHPRSTRPLKEWKYWQPIPMSLKDEAIKAITASIATV